MSQYAYKTLHSFSLTNATRKFLVRKALVLRLIHRYTLKIDTLVNFRNNTTSAILFSAGRLSLSILKTHLMIISITNPLLTIQQLFFTQIELYFITSIDIIKKSLIATIITSNGLQFITWVTLFKTRLDHDDSNEKARI